MFDFLKGGKATIQLTLDRPSGTYQPGETIHATVNVQGVKDLKIQNAKIALVSREDYEYRPTPSISDDDDDDDDTSKVTDEQRVWEQQFLGETTIKSDFKQTFEFDIPIPAAAHPTVSSGKILNLTWQVKGTLDRRMAGDIEDKKDIVLVGSPVSTGSGGDLGSSNEPGEAEMLLRLSSTQFAPGETINGALLIRPKKSFDASEIRIELVRREFVPREQGNESKQQDSIKLAGSTKFTAGQDVNLPFQLAIPPARPITANTPHGTIDWTLRGVLARRMRGDTVVEQSVILVGGGRN